MLITHSYEDNDIVSIFLSSNVIMSKYLPTLKELIVIYKSGQEYIYEDVDIITYIDFVRSDSQGKFINSNITNKFKFTKSDNKVDVQPIMESIQKYKNSIVK